jgi:archaellum component FlaG (FlaF/FlaG flagellin family)
MVSMSQKINWPSPSSFNYETGKTLYLLNTKDESIMLPNSSLMSIIKAQYVSIFPMK